MNSTEPTGWAKLLSGVLHANFGPGAIGRIGTIAKAGMVVIALLAIAFGFRNIWVGAAFAALDIAFIFYCVHQSFGYAKAFPEAAAMDGAQISRVLIQQGAMRPLEGLSQPPPIVSEVIQNPLIEKLEGEQ
ncbi:hypothetical protein [Brevundimonas sp. GCM10030266]|uniref:hypothetical protein n=1 Tax=Brevundimonas sp. GCM10030266 TaxID=3273386 RepID=UPI00360E67F2